MTKALGFAGVILLALSVEAAARCSVPRFPMLNNQTVDASMTVTSGTPCYIRLLNSLGPTYSFEIVQRPSNGAANGAGQNRIVYRSRAGFVGGDAFTFASRGESMVGNAAVRTVRIAVTVTR